MASVHGSRQRAQILCERHAVRLPRRQYRRHAEYPHKECAHGHVQQQHDAAEKLQTSVPYRPLLLPAVHVVAVYVVLRYQLDRNRNSFS